MFLSFINVQGWYIYWTSLKDMLDLIHIELIVDKIINDLGSFFSAKCVGSQVIKSNKMITGKKHNKMKAERSN